MAPKMSPALKEATEIRCSKEKSNGGLSYQVVLAEASPNVALPKKPITTRTNKNSVSVEDIKKKLKPAEERKISLEAQKKADILNKLAKVEEASRKKDALNTEFMTQTKEASESKMEPVFENRQAILADIKEKLKNRVHAIEKIIDSLVQQKAVGKAAIEEKLEVAQPLREKNLKKKSERLKGHSNKVPEIKSKAMLSVEEKAKIIEDKFYAAEQKRKKKLQKKLKQIRGRGRRAELVRQNKAALKLSGETDDTSKASSSG